MSQKGLSRFHPLKGSSSSSRGGDESPEYNQILDVKREKTFEKTPDQEHGILKSSSRYDSKVLIILVSWDIQMSVEFPITFEVVVFFLWCQMLKRFCERS
jgi:hypothetical protein